MAIDGKTLCGSKQRGAYHAHLVSARSQRLGLVLAQVAVPDKINEITAIDDLLAQLVLTGWVVTTDARFTQREIATTMLAAGGDYLMEMKGNQPTLHEEVIVLFADPDLPVTQATETRLHGSRIETRTLQASTQLNGYSDWPGLARAVCVERRVTHKVTGETRGEVAYAVTSLMPAPATPAQLLQVWREHWHIETRLHWVRGCPMGGITYDEDRSTVRMGTIPQAMAAIRNMAIGVMWVQGVPNIAAACRRFAAQPALALAALGLSTDNE